MRLLNPEVYFFYNDPAESLVHSISYFPKMKELRIVISYSNIRSFLSNGSGSKLRDFREFVFVKVDYLRKSKVMLKLMMSTGYDFYFKEGAPCVFLENLEVQRQEGYYKVRINFGTFGIYMFHTEGLVLRRKLAKATQISENEWSYHEHNSEKSIDFYSPFST